MASTGKPRPSRSGRITWTGVGSLTAIAALALMFGLAMVGLSDVENDPFEAALGYVLGAIGLGGWALLVVVAGRILFVRCSRRRGLLAVAPALVSIAWCALAGALVVVDAASSLPAWPSSFSGLETAIVLSLLTAGALPVALALPVVNTALRLMPRRFE